MARGVAGLVVALALLAGTDAAAGTPAEAAAERIRSALAADASLADHRRAVTVTAEATAVRLAGTVRLYRDKLMIERVARAAAGEVALRYDVHVAPVQPLSDREIERRIVAVAKAARFQGSELVVSASAGEVVVRGIFHDPVDVVFLTEQIASLEGVRSIEIDARFPV